MDTAFAKRLFILTSLNIKIANLEMENEILRNKVAAAEKMAPPEKILPPAKVQYFLACCKLFSGQVNRLFIICFL